MGTSRLASPLRHCNSCGRSNDDTAFYPSYRTQCKECLKAKAVAKRPEKLAYLRRWRAENPCAFRRWYASNKGRRSAYWKHWYAGHKAERALSYADWVTRNRHAVNAIIARRGAAKKRATVAWASDAAIKSIYARALRLTTETGIRHEVDHVYPLQSDWVCGLHCEANLQILTKEENIRKGNKRMSEAA